MPRPWPRWTTFYPVLVAVALLILAGCGLGQTATSPSPTYCDGISSEVGGCDPDRPTFIGQTCEAVAQEFGRQLDGRLVAIYKGAESPTASKAVRAGQYTSVAASLANLQLRRVGQIKACSAPGFIASAEPFFSPELRAHAGELLHDGDPVSYEAWRVTIVDLLSIIDMEEDAPAPASAPMP